MRQRIVVIGAGAAGLIAAKEAALRQCDVTLLEKSSKTGVKILMSGGTRCNLTHDTDAQGITAAFGHAKRFLQPSVGAFGPRDLVDMFHRGGLTTKVESTGKVFPESDRALHVRDLLHRQAVSAGVEIRLNCGVTAIDRAGDHWLVQTSDDALDADRVIVTVGGRSYPGCGTTGDGYRWLEKLGHRIVPTRPALVPLVGGARWTHDLSGLTLDDTIVTVKQPGVKKPIANRRSSLLFTHFGLSGPAAMDVSGSMTAVAAIEQLRLTVDLVPEISAAEIGDRLSDREQGRRQVAKILTAWLPNRLAQAVIERSNADRSLAELPKSSRLALIESLKRLPIAVTGTRGFPKAEVTAGGVSLGEVDPRTMESRICPRLYIAGEVLDVDGPIGGYNFQSAFSTGRAAGIAAATS